MKRNNADISPELASKVVSNYLLPMFESTTKRTLKSKYDKMAMLRSRNANSRISQTFNKSQNDNTVYGELKLSQQLSEKVDKIKAELNKMEEDKEEMAYLNQTLAQELENQKGLDTNQSHKN